jgi:hypothetical protein
VFAHHSLFASHAALTRQALLSNIGQSRKELLPGTAWQAHPIVIIWKDASALIARRNQLIRGTLKFVLHAIYFSLYFASKVKTTND